MYFHVIQWLVLLAIMYLHRYKIYFITEHICTQMADVYNARDFKIKSRQNI